MKLKRKHILRFILSLAVIIIALHVVSALTQDRIIQYKEITFASPEIPPELDGYVIAFVTDTHALPKAKLEQAVTVMNARGLGLLLLGGDFPAADGAAWRSMEVLGQTVTKDGIYGVDGNHDRYRDLFDAMRANNITPLDNAGLYIKPRFYLAGVADLWQREPNVAKAVQNAEDNDFVLLLSHNPDVAMQQNTTKVDLMLAGHTHGGHITFLGLWAPRLWPLKGISNYGQKFMGGWVNAPHNTRVFVSRGAGPIETAPRVFARPQIIFLTLQSK